MYFDIIVLLMYTWLMTCIHTCMHACNTVLVYIVMPEQTKL